MSWDWRSSTAAKAQISPRSAQKGGDTILNLEYGNAGIRWGRLIFHVSLPAMTPFLRTTGSAIYFRLLRCHGHYKLSSIWDESGFAHALRILIVSPYGKSHRLPSDFLWPRNGARIPGQDSSELGVGALRIAFGIWAIHWTGAH